MNHPPQSMSDNLTEQFLNNLPLQVERDISSIEAHLVKRCLLDYLGVTLAGSKILAEKAHNLLRFFGHGDNAASVIGLNEKAGVSDAAFINGLNAHVAELDDGVNTGIVHPGAPVFSALLVMAEKESVTARAFILGVIAGYEATVRMADSIQPAHKLKGYHATGTCGALGAAIGLAVMLGLSKTQVKHAFSAAAIAASGTLKALDDASQLKPFNVGRAAVTGLQSVAMARAGFIGPADVLGGGNGFLSVMTDKCDRTHWTGRGRNLLAVQRVYTKPYAACRYCHPAIEAALVLHKKLSTEEIDTVTVSTYQLAVTNHDHVEISGVSSAKMSIPYSVAVALVSGRAGLSEFTDEWISHPAVVSLIKRIKVVSSDEFTSRFPAQCCAHVKLVDQMGREQSVQIDYPKGEPENALSDNELENKFSELARFAGKTDSASRALAATVWGLSDSMEDLFALL